MATGLASILELYPDTPSETVTCRWYTRTTHWKPNFLAAISSLYRSIPHCKDFEINYRETISNDRSAKVLHSIIPNMAGCGVTDNHPYPDFHCMMLGIDDFDEYGIGAFEMEDEYWALDVCNYLGIRADGYYFEDRLSKLLKAQSKEKNVMTLIPYHQMFLQTNYEEGLVLCDDLFQEIYGERTTKYSPKPVHLRSMVRSDENKSLQCKIRAYVEFAKSISKLEPRVLTFLKERLGWEREIECCGVYVTIPYDYPDGL